MDNGIQVEPGGESTRGAGADAVRTLWGYVSRGQEPRAAYYLHGAALSPSSLEVVVSVGAWGDGSRPDQREVVGLVARVHNGRLAFMLMDAHDTGLATHDFLGVLQRASEVRNTDLAREVFAILDRVLEADGRVAALRAAMEGTPR